MSKNFHPENAPLLKEKKFAWGGEKKKLQECNVPQFI